MQKIVLASQSPRRKKLLDQIGLIFEIIPSTKEENSLHMSPKEMVMDLAFQKANDISHQVSDTLVIGSDTVVVFEDQILGKPKTSQDATAMLNKLSGKTHSVFTGVCLILTDSEKRIEKQFSFYEETKVTFSTLSPQEIFAYVSSGSPFDKAGAYGIQDDWGSVFVQKIEGDYYNVVGFPINRFYRELKKFGPSFLNHLSIPAVIND